MYLYFHIIESQTFTSTPDLTPIKTSFQQSSPKSILKGRKIIDDNVKVDSKLETNDLLENLNEGLNFSYSDEEEDFSRYLTLANT